MEIREIPHSEWDGLCSHLKEAHCHSLITVRVRKAGGLRELVARPLAELTIKSADESILIAVGDQWDGYLGHAVMHPTRMRVLGSREREEVLLIEAADGSTTEVNFYPAD